jgi:ribosome-binding factor A
MPIESDGQSLRCRRVAEALKEVCGQVITQELNDPRAGFVTVTRVKVTADLKHARVFVTVLGEESDRSKALAALKHAAGYIKRRCGDELKLRFTPYLAFELDRGVDRSIRVSELLYSASHEPPPEKLPPLEDAPSEPERAD